MLFCLSLVLHDSSFYSISIIFPSIDMETQLPKLPRSLIERVEAIFFRLEQSLIKFFASFPHLPTKGREVLVVIAPWISLLAGVFSLFSFIGLVPLLAYFAFFFSPFLLLSTFFILIAAVLELLAFQPLLTKKRKGWNYLFYATTFSFIGCLVDLLFYYGSFGTIVGFLLGLWLLFEVRDMYQSS